MQTTTTLRRRELHTNHTGSFSGLSHIRLEVGLGRAQHILCSLSKEQNDVLNNGSATCARVSCYACIRFFFFLFFRFDIVRT